MPEKKGQIMPPFKMTAKGTSIIDWEEMTRLYLDQKMTARDFLDQFKGVDVTKQKAVTFLKKWESEKYRSNVKTYDQRKHVQKIAQQENIPEETVKERMRYLQLRQNLEEWEAAEAIKHSIMLQLQSDRSTVHELGMMSKSLEVLFKLQRIALNMPVNGEGDAKLAIEAEATVKQASEKKKEDVPTFVVEMNDNGKFKRLKPRKKS
jgi:hypothetical protein